MALNVASEDPRMMAAVQKTPREVSHKQYRCQKCDGSIVREYGSWRCTDCGHVPFHGAD